MKTAPVVIAIFTFRTVALAHMVDASCCTCTQGGGGMITFVALAHMVDATSLTLVVALAHMVDATSLTLVVALAHRGVGGGDDNVRCTCTHG